VFYSVTLSYNRLMTTEKSEERNYKAFRMPLASAMRMCLF